MFVECCTIGSCCEVVYYPVGTKEQINYNYHLKQKMQECRVSPGRCCSVAEVLAQSIKGPQVQFRFKSGAHNWIPESIPSPD